MVAIRKSILIREVLETEPSGRPMAPPITRVAIGVVFRNPLSGQFSDDLSPLFEIGSALGERFAREAVTHLASDPVSYGKAAIVGTAGEMEHGGAVIHPKLGAPMRGAAGGGEAVIPSNVKIGGPATTIDLPLGHKDNPWSFDHFDTMTISVPDGPMPDEIAIFLAYADGGRLNPRCGPGPQRN